MSKKSKKTEKNKRCPFCNVKLLYNEYHDLPYDDKTMADKGERITGYIHPHYEGTPTTECFLNIYCESYIFTERDLELWNRPRVGEVV